MGSGEPGMGSRRSNFLIPIPHSPLPIFLFDSEALNGFR
jgi:hypothetical protein